VEELKDGFTQKTLWVFGGPKSGISKKKRNWNAVFQAFPHDIPEPQVFLFMRNEDFISQIVGVPEDQRVKSAVD
jgi:hypothetical protein